MTLPALRPYQQQLDWEVDQAWQHGARNVLMRLATGGGKTILLATIVARHRGASVVIAHRDNLLLQLSLELARAGIRHNLIAARDTRQAIIAAHIIKLGQSWYDPGARCAVASVRTLNTVKNLDHWFAQVTLWVVDEAHHLVLDNEWHSAISRFTHPAVRGLMPTATPERADGKGLGREYDGVADVMVEGPPEAWLIDEGYLCEYRIAVAESDVVRILEGEKVGKSGDYSPKVLRAADRASHIVGDVVQEYLRWAPGRLWATFTSNVETAGEIARAYNEAGVRAEVLTGETPYGLRNSILGKLERRDILQLVAVDIVSEGFDLPALEGGSDARKTESLANYRQRFGRVLRPMWAEGSGYGAAARFNLDTRSGRRDSIAASPKPKAWWIDHVGNVPHHKVPDRARVWTLGRRGQRKGGGGDGIPLRTCIGVRDLVTMQMTGCYQPYERFHTACPYCGIPAPAPAVRSSPAAVDGDLVELDEATLAALRGAVAVADMSLDDFRVRQLQAHVPMQGVMAGVKRHEANQTAQAVLREAMVTWMTAALGRGLTDREAQKLWFLTWGVDVLTARALGRADAEALTARLTGSSGSGMTVA